MKSIRVIILLFLPITFTEISSTEVIECKVPRHYSLTTPLRAFTFDSGSFHVSLDLEKLKVEAFNDSHLIKVTGNDVRIDFAGQVHKKKTKGQYVLNLDAVAERQHSDFTEFTPIRWNILLSDFKKKQPSDVYRREIVTIAELCLERILDKILPLEEDNLRFSETVNGACMLPIGDRYQLETNEIYTLEPLLLSIFSKAIIQVKDKMITDKTNGVMTLEYFDLTKVMKSFLDHRTDRDFVIMKFIITSGTISGIQDLKVTEKRSRFSEKDGHLIFMTDYVLQNFSLYGQFDVITSYGEAKGEMTASSDRAIFIGSISIMEKEESCLKWQELKMNPATFESVESNLEVQLETSNLQDIEVEEVENLYYEHLDRIFVEILMRQSQQWLDRVDCTDFHP